MNREVSVSQSPPEFDSIYIKEIHDFSDDFSYIRECFKKSGLSDDWVPAEIQRIRIIFHNNYQISIIRGSNTFGGRENLFEIAVFNPQTENFDPSKFDDCDRGGDVLGHCSIEKVRYYIDKIGRLTPIDYLSSNIQLLENKK